MTDTKNEAPERLWAWSFNIWDTWGGYARPENRHPLDERERRTGAEYVRADLLADMTRQRDDQAAALILAKEALEHADADLSAMGFSSREIARPRIAPALDVINKLEPPK